MRQLKKSQPLKEVVMSENESDSTTEQQKPVDQGDGASGNEPAEEAKTDDAPTE
jgi:hypothetical protein